MEALVAYLSHCLLYREEIFRKGSETVPARIPMHVRKPDHNTSSSSPSSSSSGRGQDEHLFLASERFHSIDGCVCAVAVRHLGPDGPTRPPKELRVFNITRHPTSVASPPVACAQLLQSPSHSSNGLSFSSLFFSVVGRPCGMMRYTIYVGVRHSNTHFILDTDITLPT